MKYSVAASIVGSAVLVCASPTPSENARARLAERDHSMPTVYLAGDSTMAKAGGGEATEGWGTFLPFSLKIPVDNNAMAGRSARSFTREERFDDIANTVQEGDWVVIEFGHNDGGSPNSNDNGRSACPGDGDETCSTTQDGVTETVLTFPAYIQNAAQKMIDKGAQVIISSPTPNNPWEAGTFSYSPGRFMTYGRSVAETLNQTFVDHGSYAGDFYERGGLEKVNSFYPRDHTHTSPGGARWMASAFIKGVLCGESDFKQYVKNSTDRVFGECLT